MREKLLAPMTHSLTPLRSVWAGDACLSENFSGMSQSPMCRRASGECHAPVAIVGDRPARVVTQSAVSDRIQLQMDAIPAHT